MKAFKNSADLCNANFSVVNSDVYWKKTNK